MADCTFFKNSLLKIGALCFALIDFSQAVLSYTLNTAFYVSDGVPAGGEYSPPYGSLVGNIRADFHVLCVVPRGETPKERGEIERVCGATTTNYEGKSTT